MDPARLLLGFQPSSSAVSWPPSLLSACGPLGDALVYKQPPWPCRIAVPLESRSTRLWRRPAACPGWAVSRWPACPSVESSALSTDSPLEGSSCHSPRAERWCFLPAGLPHSGWAEAEGAGGEGRRASDPAEPGPGAGEAALLTDDPVKHRRCSHCRGRSGALVGPYAGQGDPCVHTWPQSALVPLSHVTQETMKTSSQKRCEGQTVALQQGTHEVRV